MSQFFNLVRATTATTGTGAITPGAAVSGYKAWSTVPSGAIVPYGIKDGANSEAGWGVWNGTTLTRNVTSSTNSDALISLSGSAEVYITPRGEDVRESVSPAHHAAFGAL